MGGPTELHTVDPDRPFPRRRESGFSNTRGRIWPFSDPRVRGDERRRGRGTLVPAWGSHTPPSSSGLTRGSWAEAPCLERARG